MSTFRSTHPSGAGPASPRPRQRWLLCKEQPERPIHEGWGPCVGLWISVSRQILIDALASSPSRIRVWGPARVRLPVEHGIHGRTRYTQYTRWYTRYTPIHRRTPIVTLTLGPSTDFSVVQLVDNHLLLTLICSQPKMAGAIFLKICCPYPK